MKKSLALLLLGVLLLSQAAATAALCVCPDNTGKAACHCPDGKGCCGSKPSNHCQVAADSHPEATLTVLASVTDFVSILPHSFLQAIVQINGPQPGRIEKRPPRIRTPDRPGDPLRGPPSLA